MIGGVILSGVAARAETVYCSTSFQGYHFSCCALWRRLGRYVRGGRPHCAPMSFPLSAAAPTLTSVTLRSNSSVTTACRNVSSWVLWKAHSTNSADVFLSPPPQAAARLPLFVSHPTPLATSVKPRGTHSTPDAPLR